VGSNSRYFGSATRPSTTDIISGIDFFLFGYDQGVMGGLLTLGSFVGTFPEIDVVAHPNDNHISTIQGISVASYNVWCFIGAIITIFIGDILGRRKMIFL
jgi:MFS family permease